MNRKTSIVVVVGLVLASASGWTAERPSGGGPGVVPEVVTASERALAVARRLTGRVLGSFIQKGMTEDEVRRLMGEEDMCLHFNNRGEETTMHALWYEHLGLSVTFLNYDPCTGLPIGTMRVTHASFEPLFQ